MNVTLKELLELTPEQIIQKISGESEPITPASSKSQSIDEITKTLHELEQTLQNESLFPERIIETSDTPPKEIPQRHTADIDTPYDTDGEKDMIELGGFNDDRDTPEDAYRDKYSIPKKKIPPRKKEELYGLHGERDSVEDAYADKYGTGIQPEPDIAPLYPDALPQKLTAQRASKEAFNNIANIDQHKKGTVLTANDGCQYKIVSISEKSNRVKLLSLETLSQHSTPLDKFFGIERKFPYKIGDDVIYKGERYPVDGISPSNNTILLAILNKYVRISQVEKFE